MTADVIPLFSSAVLEPLLAEAQALNLKGATAITVALRNQLADMKSSGKVPDNRTQTYYLAARVVNHGISTPLDGVADVEGLSACNALAGDIISDAFDIPREYVSADLLDGQFKSARVNLTRKGEAHLQVQVDHDGANPVSWLDLFVFLDADRAALMASTLPTGKVF